MNSNPMAKCSQRTPGWRVASLAGWALVAAWAAWWVYGFTHGELWGVRLTRVPAWKFLGLDFQHNYDAARFWLSGHNPYVEQFGDWRGTFAYPPIVLPLFAWCALLSQHAAYVVWTAFVGCAIAAGAAFAARTRELLGLVRLPLPLIVGGLLWSLPVLFAAERGQTDVLVLLALVVAALALERPASWGRDLLIGLCLAVATWIKIYPVFALLALVPLRAWRAFALGVLQAALIGLIPLRATMLWIRTSAEAQKDRVGFVTEIKQWLFDHAAHRPAELSLYPTISADAHSLTTYWATFWKHFGMWWLERMPGALGAMLVLMPPALWVSLRVLRSADAGRARVAYPYLLWLVAIATFLMPVSYDYNLFYLPLAALAVWDRRDPWVLSALTLAATFVWWQPLRLPAYVIDEVYMGLKVLSLTCVGVHLVRRLSDAVGGGDAALGASEHGFDVDRLARQQ